MSRLLDVKNLQIQLKVGKEVVTPVDDITFSIKQGETIGIVGESGCGKSMTANAIMGLLPQNVGYVSQGEILVNDDNITQYTSTQWQHYRGKEVSMIFQEPMTSLNPVYKIGTQMIEMIRSHQSMSKKEAKTYAIEMLRKVGIPSPEKRINEYPHQLSGGMKQRVMIAMALSTHPKLLIADEPTTALDVTIQAQILELMQEIKETTGTSILLISHDMGVVAQTCDRVIVMYAGKIVEQGFVKDIFNNPLHPYTQRLLESIPRIDNNQEELSTIEGTVPALDELPKGCRFCTRCHKRYDQCQQLPPQKEYDGHQVSCWLYQNEDIYNI